MTADPEPHAGQAKDPPPQGGKSEDLVPAALPPAVGRFLLYGRQKIRDVLDTVDEGMQTLDFLERQLESTAKLYFAVDAKRVPLAEYLYVISVQCRRLIKDNAGYFYARDWDEEADTLLQLAFKKLQSSWTTYHSVLRDYNESSWDQGAPRSRILQGLEAPRDAFIEVLGQYNSQLDVALDCLR